MVLPDWAKRDPLVYWFGADRYGRCEEVDIYVCEICHCHVGDYKRQQHLDWHQSKGEVPE